MEAAKRFLRSLRRRMESSCNGKEGSRAVANEEVPSSATKQKVAAD
jgi:hypothetical protein